MILIICVLSMWGLFILIENIYQPDETKEQQDANINYVNTLHLKNYSNEEQ